jgi:membrane protein involved in colicin uptake
LLTVVFHIPTVQEQDERDRKATLKEERRLLAAEKKQAEEKAKAENERKARMAEVEKKKQEREEAMKARTTFKVKVPTNHAPVSSLLTFVSLGHQTNPTISHHSNAPAGKPTGLDDGRRGQEAEGRE